MKGVVMLQPQMFKKRIPLVKSSTTIFTPTLKDLSTRVNNVSMTPQAIYTYKRASTTAVKTHNLFRHVKLKSVGKKKYLD